MVSRAASRRCSIPPACRAALGIGTCSNVPGYYTGYGVKTMPGIREVLEQKYFREAAAQQLQVAATLGRLAARLARDTARLC